MHKIIGMEEWNKMISSMHRVDRIMREIDISGADKIKREWDNMMNSVTSIQNSMKEERTR